MAGGVQKKFSKEIGISLIGIAGTLGGNKEKPVGIVYIAISNKGVTKGKKINLKQNEKKKKRNTSKVG
jgi:Uncharacterized protein (competence- and mitomycin-induced)